MTSSADPKVGTSGKHVAGGTITEPVGRGELAGPLPAELTNAQARERLAQAGYTPPE